ncbi:MAG TPA: DUF58 domain-containing protein [Pseudonocardiaceae bacterium]|nr:DUF58 domain-containing protein [Pseudonocardiaceae bacterium]
MPGRASPLSARDRPATRCGLTTRGWCLLATGAAVAVCAVLINERDLLRLAAFAVTLPLLALAVITRTQLGLHAERELVPSRTSAGSACEARLTLRFTGPRRSRVLLEDAVPRMLGGPHRAAVAPSSGDAEVTLSYPLRPAERRVHSLGPLIARVTDPLGLAQRSRTLAGISQLVVLPAVVPLAGLPAGGEPGAGPAANRSTDSGTGGDSLLVRDYRPGDDLRRVHWRTSARRDELMVRTEEWSEHSELTVLLDHRAQAHRGAGPASSLEYAVTLAASVYLHLRQRALRVRLVTVDGVVLADAEHTGEGALDALAALTMTDQRDLAGVPEPAGRCAVVAVLGALGSGAAERLLASQRRGRRNRAVLLDVAAWARPGDGQTAPPPAKAAQLLAAAGWSVVAAGPDQPPSSVWDQLCLDSSFLGSSFLGSAHSLGAPR